MNTDPLKTLLAIPFAHLNQMRHGGDARSSVDSPILDCDDLPAKIGEFDVLTRDDLANFPFRQVVIWKLVIIGEGNRETPC